MRLLVQLCIIIGLLAGVAFAQNAAPTQKLVDLPPPLDQVYPEIVEEISKLRGLEWQEDVAALVQKRDALRKHLLEIIDREIPPEMLAGREAALRKLGIYEEDMSLRDLLVNAYTSQMAGFYDPSKKTLYILDDLLLLSTDIIAHELTHALQDQHYDLESLPISDMTNSDLAMALTALIEGDATIAMVRFMEKRLGAPPSAGEAIIERIEGEMGMSVRFMDMPYWFKEELVFPYIGGARFVSKLMSMGGWERVDRAFDELPLSTEQILHAEKYLEAGRDDPQGVVIPDLADALGGACKEVFSDCMGELGVRILLQKHAPKFAKKAAAGWDGDRAVAYASEEGRVTVAIVSVWDDPDEARQFQLAMLRRSLARDARSVRSGEHADSRVILLQSPDDTVFLERRDARVVFVVGAPIDRIEAVRGALWQSRFSEITAVVRAAPVVRTEPH